MRRHTIIPRALAASAFLTTACLGATVHSQGVFTIETVLADGMWNNPTSTAIDEDGVIHVAFMTQFHTDSATKEIWYARKAPGDDWSFTQITDNDVREEFPSIAIDADGNVHIAFHSGVASGGNMIRYVNNIGMPDGSFNPIEDITGEGYVIVRLAVDSTGTVHLVFRTQFFGGTPQEIYYTTWSEKSGAGPLTNISQSAAQDDSSVQVALDADDNVHIVWQRGSALGGPLAYVNNTSGSFQEVPTSVAGGVLDPMIVIDEAGKISLFYRPGFDALRYVESTDDFTQSYPVYTGTYRSAFMDRIAVDANGHRYVAFASNIQENRGMFFVQETEDGWLEPELLAGEDGGNQGSSVAINSRGELALTYSISGFADGVVFADIFHASTQIDLGGDCPTDLNGDDLVNVFDLLTLLSAWGDCPGCDADLNGDDVVNVFDLLTLLSAWGDCP